MYGCVVSGQEEGLSGGRVESKQLLFGCCLLA